MLLTIYPKFFKNFSAISSEICTNFIQGWTIIFPFFNPFRNLFLLSIKFTLNYCKFYTKFVKIFFIIYPRFLKFSQTFSNFSQKFLKFFSKFPRNIADFFKNGKRKSLGGGRKNQSCISKLEAGAQAPLCRPFFKACNSNFRGVQRCLMKLSCVIFKRNSVLFFLPVTQVD